MKSSTVCFTGHRPSKLSFKYNENHPQCLLLKQRLKTRIIDAIENGYHRFFTGMAIGVDTWAAEAVLELKEKYPLIKLLAAVPCTQQEKTWPRASKERYHRILNACDEVHQVSDQPYSAKRMLDRDQYMVDRSQRIIAVYNGKPGGTAHTIQRAKESQLVIDAIHPETPPQTLECSSKGDKRFSAFSAYVSAFGMPGSIETHYQLSKRFGEAAPPKTIKAVKGKTPSHMALNGQELPIRFLTPWYKLLWVKYLDKNPDLVSYARSYDIFQDAFSGKSVNVQSDVIRQYAQEGRRSLWNDCHELIEILKGEEKNYEQS